MGKLLGPEFYIEIILRAAGEYNPQDYFKIEKKINSQQKIALG